MLLAKLLLTLMLSVQIAQATDCAQELKILTSQFNSRFSTTQLQDIRNQVTAKVSPNEKSEFLLIQKKFNSLPHDSDDNINTRFELQKRARVLTRQAVARAGYRLLNPIEPSPYDALILIKTSPDGYNEYSVELRSLLVEKDPLPHVTLWMQRFNYVNNPWQVMTVGLTADEKTDYVSSRNANGERIVQSKLDFLNSKLPIECQ